MSTKPRVVRNKGMDSVASKEDIKGDTVSENPTLNSKKTKGRGKRAPNHSQSGGEGCENSLQP